MRRSLAVARQGVVMLGFGLLGGALSCSDGAGSPSPFSTPTVSGAGQQSFAVAGSSMTTSGGATGVASNQAGAASLGTGGTTLNVAGASLGGTGATNAGAAAGGTLSTGGMPSTAQAGMGMGGAGTGGAGMSSATPSVGCGTAAPQALGEWVEQDALNVEGTDRQWWVWLPEGYEPGKAYPLVFTFHGCGGPDNILPMQNVAGSDAILIRGTGITDGCWTYSGTGQDVAFFDAMLERIEATSCVDTSRVFATGYSSGAWLTNTLVCARGDKLRGAGTVSGGVVGNRGECQGEVARIFLHDASDTENRFIENGNRNELDRILGVNGCDANADPIPEDPEPCARYVGCDADNPVILCMTDGKGHDRQDALATTAFWGLFQSL